jgi:hypothetical protein
MTVYMLGAELRPISMLVSAPIVWGTPLLSNSESTRSSAADNAQVDTRM